jgi:hypothetical protein
MSIESKKNSMTSLPASLAPFEKASANAEVLPLLRGLPSKTTTRLLIAVPPLNQHHPDAGVLHLDPCPPFSTFCIVSAALGASFSCPDRVERALAMVFCMS